MGCYQVRRVEDEVQEEYDPTLDVVNSKRFSIYE